MNINSLEKKQFQMRLNRGEIARLMYTAEQKGWRITGLVRFWLNQYGCSLAEVPKDIKYYMTDREVNKRINQGEIKDDTKKEDEVQNADEEKSTDVKTNGPSRCVNAEGAD